MANTDPTKSEKSPEVSAKDLGSLYTAANTLLDETGVQFTTVDMGTNPFGTRLARFATKGGASVQVGQHIINGQTFTELKTLSAGVETRSGTGKTFSDRKLEIITEDDEPVGFEYHQDTGVFVSGDTDKAVSTDQLTGAMAATILRGEQMGEPQMKHGLPTTEELWKVAGNIDAHPSLTQEDVHALSGLLQDVDPETVEIIGEDIQPLNSADLHR